MGVLTSEEPSPDLGAASTIGGNLGERDRPVRAALQEWGKAYRRVNSSPRPFASIARRIS